MTPDNKPSAPDDFTLADVDVMGQEDAVPLVANTALRAILQSLGTAPSFRECMRECALTLHQWTHADGATVFRLATGGHELEQIHSVGFPREMTERSQRLPLYGTLTGLAVRQKQLIFSQQIPTDDLIPEDYRRDLALDGMQTVLALPLLMHAQVVGAITLAWRRKLHLSEADRDLLMSIGYGIAIAVEHDLREFESTRDGLTGLLNRRAFDQRLPELRNACRRASSPLALAMLDLDDFKICNDTHGHLVGDEILRTTAGQITANMLLERGDVFRIGGEEFVLLLPNCGDEQALGLVHRIARTVANQEYSGRDGERFHVTLSAGIALYDFASSEPLSEFYARADQAMYTAKQTGKNRTVLASGGEQDG